MTSAVQRAIQINNEGNEAFKTGDMKKAYELYTKAIKIDPTNPTLYGNRAATKIVELRYAEALSDIKSCMKLSSELQNENNKRNYKKGNENNIISGISMPYYNPTLYNVAVISKSFIDQNKYLEIFPRLCYEDSNSDKWIRSENPNYPMNHLLR